MNTHLDLLIDYYKKYDKNIYKKLYKIYIKIKKNNKRYVYI